MAMQSEDSKGFLARLRMDEGGNTLAIVAASIIPLLGLIGGGVDMSRAYLSKSRLQQACDAGALAGRRAMSDGDWDEEAQDTARNFFDTNFEAGSYGTSDLVRNFTEDDNTVTGTASVSVPTSIMRMFGKESIDIAVTCTAEMKIPNTDVMFVLDTTGSMDTTNSGDSVTRMEALRDAVESFYTSLETAKGDNTRIRYGFVPYSVNVNVGSLLLRDWMVDSWEYQSRAAVPNGPPTTSTTTGSWTYVSGTCNGGTSATCSATSTTINNVSSSSACQAMVTAASASDSVTTHSSTTTDGVVTTTTTTTTTMRTTNGTTKTFRDYSSSNDRCRLWTTVYSNHLIRKIDTVAETPQYTWEYRPVEYDVSGLKGSNSDGTMAGGSITAQIGNLSSNKPTWKTVTWNGCIEERTTVRATTYTQIPTSGTLYDLDIDLVPTTNNVTRWRPALGDLVYGRRNTSSGNDNWNTSTYQTTSNYYVPSDPCPTAARKLAEIDSLSTLTGYLNSLTPTGNTYHDIGMLWGARLLSPDGLFASENTSAPNGGSITRHLIFMTDGATEPNNTVYTPYGLEPLDRRRTSSSSVPSNTDLTNVVNTRLAYLCTAVKNKNITIWVVAFGTTLTSNLSSCASTGKAYQANNATQLNDAFEEIASQISQLRLTD